MRTTALPWHLAAAAIRVELGRDTQHKDCDLAKAGGPDATLACAVCGRALWLHATRHDTCTQFSWITEPALTAQQIIQLRAISDLPPDIHTACAYALFDNARAPYVRTVRQTCADAINTAKREAYKL